MLANRLIYHFRDPQRGEVIVFETPPKAEKNCGAGGAYVKRLIGLPGKLWSERNGFVYIDGKKLDEPYLSKGRRDFDTYRTRQIPAGRYFFMGDNRRFSCDSRRWGTVPRANIVGEVFATYWPPSRISVR